jgi:hypothetical protein
MTLEGDEMNDAIKRCSSCSYFRKSEKPTYKNDGHESQWMCFRKNRDMAFIVEHIIECREYIKSERPKWKIKRKKKRVVELAEEPSLH